MTRFLAYCCSYQEGECVCWHCAVCDEPCGPQGHDHAASLAGQVAHLREAVRHLGHEVMRVWRLDAFVEWAERRLRR